MMEKLAAEGFAAVSFNFTHNGVAAESPQDFTRLDLFAQNTHSAELNELNAVVDYFYTNAAHYRIDKNKIALIGHSRGGGDAILQASADNRIKALVTLSAISTVDRYTAEQKKRWREKGFIEIPNARTGQMMRMNKTFLDDIEKNSARLDILSAASKIEIPFLIIHGREDLAVKFTDAEKIYSASNKDHSELFPVENTGHTFGTVHPFEGTTKAFDKAVDKAAGFIKKGLKL